MEGEEETFKGNMVCDYFINVKQCDQEHFLVCVCIWVYILLIN